MPYSFKRSITIDHTKCGSANSTNFPVLINSTHADLKTVGNGGHVQNANGFDIAFFADANLQQQLDFHKYFYSATTGQWIGRVRVPTVSSSADTIIYIAYGDSAISSSQENITGTWNSNHKAVFHWGDGNSLDLLDATSNDNDGTGVNTPTAIAGKVHGAVRFNGSSNYTHHGDNGSLDFGTGDFSVMLWLRKNSSTLNLSIALAKSVSSTGFSLSLIDNGGPLVPRLVIEDGVDSVTRTYSDNLTNDVWAFLVWSCTRATATDPKYYRDGAVQTCTNNCGTDFTTVGDISNANELTVGQRAHENPGNYFNGDVDELRFFNVALSADWILTQYNNEVDPSTFYTLGLEQVGVAATGRVTYVPRKVQRLVYRR